MRYRGGGAREPLYGGDSTVSDLVDKLKSKVEEIRRDLISAIPALNEYPHLMDLFQMRTEEFLANETLKNIAQQFFRGVAITPGRVAMFIQKVMSEEGVLSEEKEETYKGLRFDIILFSLTMAALTAFVMIKFPGTVPYLKTTCEYFISSALTARVYPKKLSDE